MQQTVKTGRELRGQENHCTVYNAIESTIFWNPAGPSKAVTDARKAM